MIRESSFLSFNSIQAKFLAFVVPLVLLSTIAVFGLFEFNARRDANLMLQDKLDKLVAIQSAVVAKSLWNFADEQIKLILAALAIDPDIESAAVYNEQDQLVGFTGSADGIETRPLSASKEIVYVSGEKPEVIGRLAISLTDTRLQSAAQERMFLAGVLAAILLVSVVFSALRGNRRTIGIPLERLLASISRSREGGERQAVDWRSNDEIGAVVSAFNEMQGRQKAYERELEEARDMLERRVEERTRALAHLARFPSENPNPVLRVMHDGAVLYANDAAIAVNGLLQGRKKSMLARDLAGVFAEASGTAEVREIEFESGDRVFAFSIAPVADETYINVYGRDISIRKQAEEALRASETLLQTVLEAIEYRVLVLDSDLRIRVTIRAYRDFLNFPEEFFANGPSFQGDMEFTRKHGYYAIPDDEWDDYLERRLEAIRNGDLGPVEVHYAEGTVFHHQCIPLPDGGRMLNYFDITERKRAEEELAEKEAQLRVALDNMPGGMKLVDRDLNYVLFNAQYSELCDFPDGLLKVGGSLRDECRYQADRGDFGPGDKDDLIEEVIAIYQRGKAVSYEREIAGSGRTVQINIAPTPEGGCVSIITDITERKRAEAELAEKEAQLRLALDNMPGGMMLADRDLNYVLFNSQHIRLCEYPDDLLKVGASMYDALRYQADRGDYGPGDQDDLIEQVAALYRQGEAASWERTVATGRTLEFNVAPTPEGGHVEIVIDITERKRAEEALVEAKQRSEEANKLVAEKNLMLESLSSQLSKYLSPQVYASIFSGEQSVEIASKRKKLTVFFSDIADFTGTTDSLESEELTNLLNHYLTEMSKIALDYGATIDKYVGDAIIAFFGDPETRGVKEDARTCVKMAIAMQRRMQELQSEWLDMGLEKLFELRMGINTGFCTVGNFGSGDRMDYTIIGNEVNLAARLVSHAEVGGILLAHETHSLVKDTVLAEEGDTLTVKGFAKPVRTYSVVGLYDDLAEQGRILRKEQDGLRILLDLEKQDKAKSIAAIEDFLSELKD